MNSVNHNLFRGVLGKEGDSRCLVVYGKGVEISNGEWRLSKVKGEGKPVRVKEKFAVYLVVFSSP